MSNSSNSPNNPSTPPKKNVVISLKTLWNLLTNDKIANFLSIYPFLANILILVAPIVFLMIPTWLSGTLSAQNINPDYKIKICENSKIRVENRLKIEGKNAEIDKISVVDKKMQKDRLPFSCRYTLLEDEKSFEQEIYLEISPFFSDLTKDINPMFEDEINLKEVCKHDTIIKQMEKEAEIKGYYKKSDKDEILPGSPVLLEDKKDVYPVFRWVCSYDVKKQREEQYFRGRNTYSIDIKLEPYCEKKAEKEVIKRNKPTYHNHKDPYSLYCVNPHANKK